MARFSHSVHPEWSNTNRSQRVQPGTQPEFARISESAVLWASDRYVTLVTSLLRDRKTRESFTGADVTSVTCVTWKK
jgi:hypothetical protein